MRIRTVTLALAVAAITWFNFFQQSSAAAISQRAADLLDGRPARSILIVGNSRTYFNDMPVMLRKIADSAGSPTAFQVETSAYPAFTFKAHWQKERTRELLGEGWDDVILQAESGAQTTPESNADFHAYGAKLAATAKLNHGRPHLVVGWAYDPSRYEGDTDGTGRELHLEQIKRNHSRLAIKADLTTIKLAGLWESVRRSHPSIRLTSDGNHPTVAGSYLYALAVYANLTNGPVAGVGYGPDGLSPEDAKALREAVDAFPLLA